MKLKKVVALGLTMVILGGTTVFASTPAEIYSEVTGVTVEEAYEARQNGETFGKLADDKGLFEEFQQEMLEDKKVFIEEKVSDGTLTREKADEFIKTLEERIENCDPQNPQRQGQRMGIGFGKEKGNRMGGRRASGNFQDGLGKRGNGNFQGRSGANCILQSEGTVQ